MKSIQNYQTEQASKLKIPNLYSTMIGMEVGRTSTGIIITLMENQIKNQKIIVKRVTVKGLGASLTKISTIRISVRTKKFKMLSRISQSIHKSN